MSPSERTPDRATSLLFTAGIAMLPVVYVLTVYLDLGTTLFTTGRPALVTAVIATSLMALASLLLRDRVAGALVGLCLIGMLFLDEFTGAMVLLAVVAVLISIGAVQSRRGHGRWSRILRALHNIVGAFGLALLVVTVAQSAYVVRSRATARWARQSSLTRPLPTSG